MCWIFVKRTYLRVCWRSTIDLCLMNLPKRSSFKSVLKVYTLSKILLWMKPSYFSLENACYSWWMHQTGLFSSTFVMSQGKFTGELWAQHMLCHKVNLLSCIAKRPLCFGVNLPSCVARRPLFHKVNIPRCDARWRPLFHKVNLPRCEARRHHFIMTCDIFGTDKRKF